MELLNKNIFDVEAAKELDELIVKLIEFSQENYVSVSSLKIGKQRIENTLVMAVFKRLLSFQEVGTQNVHYYRMTEVL